MIDEIIKEYPMLGIEDFDLSSQADDAVMIVTKSGIDKLASSYSITFDLIDHSTTPYNYVTRQGRQEVGFIATASICARMPLDVMNNQIIKDGGVNPYVMPDYPFREIHEVGSAHHKNTDYNYELEVAFKRAKSRAVLELTELKMKFPVISKDEYFDKVGKKNSSSKAVKDQLTKDMTQQEIDRAADISNNIMDRIESKLNNQDRIRTSIQDEKAKGESEGSGE